MPKKFPNAQLSRPIPGNESLRFLNFRGEALKGRGDVLLFSPPEIESLDRVPLLLLLHGVYGCQWNWWLNGNIDDAAMGMLGKGTTIRATLPAETPVALRRAAAAAAGGG